MSNTKSQWGREKHWWGVPTCATRVTMLRFPLARHLTPKSSTRGCWHHRWCEHMNPRHYGRKTFSVNNHGNKLCIGVWLVLCRTVLTPSQRVLGSNPNVPILQASLSKMPNTPTCWLKLGNLEKPGQSKLDCEPNPPPLPRSLALAIGLLSLVEDWS